jgi:hypothetical protein
MPVDWLDVNFMCCLETPVNRQRDAFIWTMGELMDSKTPELQFPVPTPSLKYFTVQSKSRLRESGSRFAASLSFSGSAVVSMLVSLLFASDAALHPARANDATVAKIYVLTNPSPPSTFCVYNQMIIASLPTRQTHRSRPNDWQRSSELCHRFLV